VVASSTATVIQNPIPAKRRLETLHLVVRVLMLFLSGLTEQCPS
jgi:hypothetical protein